MIEITKNCNSYSLIQMKNVFDINNLYFFSNTFHKIYYGLDNAKYNFTKKSNNNKKELKRKIEQTISYSNINNMTKLMNQYKYSLTQLKSPKNSTNNIFKNIYHLIMINIRKRYDNSDTKLLISDFITSYNNLIYNFRFYLNPKILSYISKLGNIQFSSSTSKAIKILNSNEVLYIDRIKNIPDLENKLKYLYEIMLDNNFRNKNYLNKYFCNPPTLLLLDTIYGKNKKYPINVEIPTLMESEINGKELKSIRFKMNIIEFCLKNGKIEENTYIVEIGENKNKENIKKNGHNILIKNIQLSESNNIFI